MNGLRSHLLLLAAILLLVPQGWAAAPKKLDPVVLQLNWLHDFQFAGYYAAEELGYYRQAGLDVKLREGGPKTSVVQEVVAGRAQFGIGTSGLLIDRKNGSPVVALAVIFQHSPFVLIARDFQNPAQSVHSLAGKRIMLEEQGDEIMAYLTREGLPPSRFQVQEHSFRLQDLVEGKTDAMTAYLSNEPYALDRLGFKYQLFSPRSAGIDFYGDNLFTSEEELRRHPQQVKAFREASLRGWQYAVDHPDEMVELIRRKYPQAPNAEILHNEAGVLIDLIYAKQVPIGYMYAGRWRHIADVYAEIGMLGKNFPLDHFLYTPGPDNDDLLWLYRMLATALVVAMVAASVITYIIVINRHLAAGLKQRQQAEADLAEERQRLADIIAGTNVGTWEWNIQTGEVRLNDRWAAIVGYTLEELSPITIDTCRRLAHPQDFAQAQTTATRVFNRELLYYECESRMRHKNGQWVWILDRGKVARWSDDGQPLLMLGTTQDITERKKSEETIQHLLNHDRLTGLPSSRLADDRLARALSSARRSKSLAAVMFLDLDGFKEINDRFGHSAGDEVLKEVGQRLLACIRDTDTVARRGGDEFLVIASELHGPEGAALIAEKILAALSLPFHVGGAPAALSASIGIAFYPQDGLDADSLLGKADEAMYQVKRSGKNRYAFASGTAGG